MKYSSFAGEQISKLGFGAMRLPTKEDGSIDEKQTEAMIDYAISHGVNYFDTAYPYHKGMSEIVVGKILKKYPRESFFLADKFPGHQLMSEYNPKAIFEEQLKKCGVDYFDFYLLHNVYENDFEVYTSEKWGIIDYFLEQKRLGRIKHLGFSCHGGVELLEKFLNYTNGAMEFCQIQLNYLDWKLQNAKEKCEILNRHNVPIWVMEPVRGGRLASLDETSTNALKELNPNASIPSYAFRFLMGVEGVTVILSGMSDMSQVTDNVNTFENNNGLLTNDEKAILDVAVGKMMSGVPCTACRYCVDGCPMKLDIPKLMSIYNELCFGNSVNTGMRLEFAPKEELPSNCIGCGNCASVCPQRIDIPATMQGLTEKLDKLPKWKDICREREEDAKKLKENK